MSNLESIVPPVELCKQIPAGEFEDSAMTWYNFHGIPILRWRDNLGKLTGVRPTPAPTLEEVLDALADLGADFLMQELQIGNKPYCYPTESEEALRLWFEVKGIEVKNE